MSEEDEQMSNKEHTAVEAVEDFRYKRVLEEQYLNREKKSIESSRKTILLERERLEADRYDLSEHLYQEIQQDLMVLTQDLQARESAWEERQQQYAMQESEFYHTDVLLMDEVSAKRPWWKKGMLAARSGFKEVFDWEYINAEAAVMLVAIGSMIAVIVKFLTSV